MGANRGGPVKRAGRVVCAASLVTLMVSGCARARDGADAQTTVTIGYGFDERLLGPTVNMPSRFLAFEPLVAYNDRYELEGRLARSWEHSPDYRTWTVHLRSDVRWHDGVPFTAHDVKFTLDLLAHPDVAEIGSEPPEVRVLDDSTYRVSFRRPDNPLADWTWTVYFPRHLLHGLDPARFHWAAADPDEEDRLQRALQEILERDHPVTFLYPLVAPIGVARRVQGLERLPPAGPAAHLEVLWLEDSVP